MTEPVCPSSVATAACRSPRPTAAPSCPGAGEDALAVGREGDATDRSLCVPRASRPCAPVAASHSRAVLSSEPVRTRLPSGEKATALTGPLCPSSVATAAPVAASHSRAVLSPEPVRTRLAVGREGDGVRHRLCVPSSVATAAPVAASHSRAVLSSEPVRTRLPSGEKATAMTEPVCPASVAIAAPVAASQSLAVVVVGAGENALAVGREGDGLDAVSVPFERRDRCAGRRVPQPCRACRRSR